VDPFLTAFFFLAMALALVLIDLVVPSAGILLALAVICAIAADIFAFRASTQFGLWVLIGELAAIPIGLWVFAKYWASTPFGKRMIIAPAKAQPFTWEASKAVGKLGTAFDDFLPTGRIEIEGTLFDAVARVGVVKKGDRVLVVAEEMGQLFVVPDNQNISYPIASNSGTNLDSTTVKTEPTVKSLLTEEGQRASADATDQPAKNFGLQSLD
jgi:membrane-bound ClpP family serine protease